MLADFVSNQLQLNSWQPMHRTGDLQVVEMQIHYLFGRHYQSITIEVTVNYQ